jgi:hypothetical protein
MNPLISFANVTVFGALGPDGEEMKGVRVTLLGNPASAVLYSLLRGERRWKPVDRLTSAKVTENPDGSITVEGISQELVDIVGVDPAEAIVRWEVKPRGCTTCN